MSAAHEDPEAREILQGLGFPSRPRIEQPGDDWVTLAEAVDLCQVQRRIVVRAARRKALKVRWFQQTKAAPPVPMLGRGGVEQLAATLRREQRVAERRAERRKVAASVGATGKRAGDALVPAEPRPWYLAYQHRIGEGLEECRHCGATEGLLVCRVQLHKQWTLTNATILCTEHAADYPSRGGQFHWRVGMESLHDEEKAAPPKRKWGLAAIDAARSPTKSRGTVTR